MRYIWQPKRRTKMHVQRHDLSGSGTNGSLCGMVFSPAKTINAPFSLGKGVCKHCLAIADGRRAPSNDGRAEE